MATLFTRIIEGELPAHFVWKDEHCVVFLSIAPLKPGHCLVVPRVEVDHWLDLDPDVYAHLCGVSQKIGRALMQAFSPERIATLILGMEVNHMHIHVVPIWSEGDVNFRNADTSASQAALAEAAAKVREALRGLGHTEVAE
jgi:histidine triad (HIT) family protein